MPRSVISETHMTSIDYGQSFVDMIYEAGLDSVSKKITQLDFPAGQSCGTKKVEIRLISYDREMESLEVEADLQSWGMRPATIQELIALAKVVPDPQWDYTVLALGTRWLDKLGRYLVPRLTVRVGVQWHHLWSARWDDTHGASCLFAAVQE